MLIIQILGTRCLGHVFWTPGNTCKWLVSHHEFDTGIHGCCLVWLTTDRYPLGRLSWGRSRHHRHNRRHPWAQGEPISGYLSFPCFSTKARPLRPPHQSGHKDSSCRSVCSETLVCPSRPFDFKPVAQSGPDKLLAGAVRQGADIGLFLRVVPVSQGEPVFSEGFQGGQFPSAQDEKPSRRCRTSSTQPGRGPRHGPPQPR